VLERPGPCRFHRDDHLQGTELTGTGPPGGPSRAPTWAWRPIAARMRPVKAPGQDDVVVSGVANRTA